MLTPTCIRKHQASGLVVEACGCHQSDPSLIPLAVLGLPPIVYPTIGGFLE